MTIQRIEWLDNVIEQTKQIAKIGDSPIAYLLGADGNITCTLIALPEKYQQKMAIWTIMQTTQSTQIITINEAWVVQATDPKDFEIRPTNNPKKTSCFVISYFTPELSLTHIMNYENIDGKIKWTKENGYWERYDNYETSMNPYKFSKEEIKSWSEMFEIDKIKEGTKPEIKELPYNHELRIYRKDGKGYFEATHKDKIFFQTKVVQDDEKFKRELEEVMMAVDILHKMVKDKTNNGS